MHEALQSVAQVNATLEAIRTSATEQRAGIGQINEAVSHMDTITQQNAAMVEELAASAQAMQLQVDTVSSSMRLFRLHTGDKTVAELDAVQMRREQRNAAPAH
jgi:aerotaxis receptor